jgi:hypothetical protein
MYLPFECVLVHTPSFDDPPQPVECAYRQTLRIGERIGEALVPAVRGTVVAVNNVVEINKNSEYKNEQQIEV